MLQIEKKYLSQGLNTDDSEFAVGPSELINAVNLRFGTTETGAIGNLESVPGTTATTLTLPAGVNTAIGYATDEERKRFIRLNHNSNGDHAIYCYELISGATYTVLTSAQVTDGLNFSTANRINEAYMVGDLLYFTEGTTNQRRVNTEAGIKLNHGSYDTAVKPYVSPLDPTVLTVIRQPPIHQLLVDKIVASTAGITTTNNFIESYAFFFAYRYQYRDGEKSVISAYSRLMPFSLRGKQEDCIKVTVPLYQHIEQDVQSVELIVKYGNIGESFVIKTWDKGNVSDNIAIGDHNFGFTPLVYYFLNDIQGEPVDKADSAKPYESLPRTSLAMAMAKNRLFFGNNLFGYDTPLTTSLTAALVSTTDISGSYHVGKWFIMNILRTAFVGAPPGVIYSCLYFQVNNTATLFAFEQLDPTVQPPAIIDLSTSTYQTSNQAALYQYLLYKHIQPFPQDILKYSPRVDTTVYTSTTKSTLTSSLPEGTMLYKINSSYNVAIAFYDQYRRKCGVVQPGRVQVKTEDRLYDLMTYNQKITWALDNTGALTEIPTWAWYYQVLRTHNSTASFFIQDRTKNTAYVTKDTTTGSPTLGQFKYTQQDYLASNLGIALDISPLVTAGMGYSFNEGDLVKVYKQGDLTRYQLKITGQYGDWIHTELKDMGHLQGEVLYEIFTPYQKSTNEAYYEVSDMMHINFPGTAQRAYNVLSGAIAGDVYWMERKDPAGQNYFVEAMSQNPDKWKEWVTDIGWPNFVDKIGEQRRTQSICFSAKFLPGTRTNGLSSFEALDVVDVPLDNGQVECLKLTSKVQEEGSVMLAICRSETSSIYLGESRLQQADGTDIIATSTGVIGTINELKGSFGTRHPESVWQLDGIVYWYDVYKGAVVQYSTNGLFPVSNYKMTRFFRTYSKAYLKSGTTLPVVGGIDPFNKEYLLSLPQVPNVPVSTTLPTLTDLNEFDFYDGRPKTIAYKIGMDKFISTYTFFPECYGYVGVQMLAVKNGALYLHNDPDAVHNNFYGVQDTTRLMFLSNAEPAKVKVFKTCNVQANMPPLHTIFYVASPNEQVTDLAYSEYTLKEGVWYGALFRDRLSPNVPGNAIEKMFTGDNLRGESMKILLEFDTTTGPLKLKFVNVGFKELPGHKT